MEQVKRDGQLSVDDYGAFVPHGRGRREATGRGVLDGLTFAVKDLIDVAGMPTGAGNPDWLAKQAPAQRSAPVVEKSLLAGATLVGKTVTANSPSASKAATFTIPI
jgi:amidase